MSAPQVTQLGAGFFVTPQVDVAAMAWAQQNGFLSVINNRPDFESGPDQPTSAEIEAAALAAGLRYAHLPVAPGMQTAEEIARFGQLLTELPKPILAFCRSGTRSGKLYRAATGS